MTYQASALRLFLVVNLCFWAAVPLARAERVIEEVIVSAQKREESMQSVPLAVTAVGEQELADAGINDITDLSMQIPSLVVYTNTSPFNTSYRIRGIGNEGNIPTFEPATGLFVDGAFKSRSGLGLGELVDVQSIEVLKGPQSTLYGKNVTAGVISVTTKAPGQEFDASLEATGGGDGLRQIKLGINIPLSDELATRWSVVRTERDPVQQNISGDDGRSLDQLALRGQLQFEFSERGSLRIIASAADRDMASSMGDVYYSQSHLNIISNMQTQLGRGEVGPNDPYDNQVNQVKNYSFIQDSHDLSASMEYVFDSVTVNLLAGYEKYQADLDYANASQMPYQIVSFLDSQAGESSSWEFRLTNNDAAEFSWIVGAFYYQNDYTRGDSDTGEFRLLEDVEEYGGAISNEFARNVSGNSNYAVPIYDTSGNMVATVSPGTPILGVEGDVGYFTGKQKTDSFGAFVHGSYALTSSLEVVAGIRYSDEEKSASFVNRRELAPGESCLPVHEFDLDPAIPLTSLNLNLICLVAPIDNNYQGGDSWSDLTGTISLSWFPVEGSLLYATASTGFKAGGFNLEFGHFDGEDERKYDQEKVTHFELGAKSEFLDRRLRLNSALFSTSYESYQNATFVGLQFIVNNAEEVIVDGLELETTYLLGEHLTLTAAATYLDARYEEYKGGPCDYYSEADNGKFCIADGEGVPFAPEWSGSFIAQWNQALFNGEFYARAAYQYTGENLPSSERDPRHLRDPYFLLDARLGWRNGQFDVALWGKNLTDEVYLVQGAAANIMTNIDVQIGSPEGSYQTYVGEPLSAGATFKMYF
ncbi:TonB-dependent receptor [Zhongshania sp.]|uniref:TonB-dependent receptor n=1 Tax=Zhongshania sp. TaxID=1971902 RepID=UPI0035637409